MKRIRLLTNVPHSCADLNQLQLRASSSEKRLPLGIRETMAFLRFRNHRKAQLRPLPRADRLIRPPEHEAITSINSLFIGVSALRFR